MDFAIIFEMTRVGINTTYGQCGFFDALDEAIASNYTTSCWDLLKSIGFLNMRDQPSHIENELSN